MGEGPRPHAGIVGAGDEDGGAVLCSVGRPLDTQEGENLRPYILQKFIQRIKLVITGYLLWDLRFGILKKHITKTVPEATEGKTGVRTGSV